MILFPAFCRLRYEVVTETECHSCFYECSVERMLQKNLVPIIDNAMICKLTREQLIAAVGNCLGVAQGPEHDTNGAICTLCREIWKWANGELTDSASVQGQIADGSAPAVTPDALEDRQRRGGNSDTAPQATAG